jgi:hypothetical protein
VHGVVEAWPSLSGTHVEGASVRPSSLCCHPLAESGTVAVALCAATSRMTTPVFETCAERSIPMILSRTSRLLSRRVKMLRQLRWRAGSGR